MEFTSFRWNLQVNRRHLQLRPGGKNNTNDFLDMFFEKTYKPIPLLYNLVLAMLWRHPRNVELDKVKVIEAMEVYGKRRKHGQEDIKVLVQRWWDIYNDEMSRSTRRSSRLLSR